MKASLSMWSWRIQESAAYRLPGWMRPHSWACPFCRGMRKQRRRRL